MSRQPPMIVKFRPTRGDVGARICMKGLRQPPGWTDMQYEWLAWSSSWGRMWNYIGRWMLYSRFKPTGHEPIFALVSAVNRESTQQSAASNWT